MVTFAQDKPCGSPFLSIHVILLKGLLVDTSSQGRGGGINMRAGTTPQPQTSLQRPAKSIQENQKEKKSKQKKKKNNQTCRTLGDQTSSNRPHFHLFLQDEEPLCLKQRPQCASCCIAASDPQVVPTVKRTGSDD